MIFDGHSDLLYDVTRRRLRGEDHVLERHHLDDLRRGGVEGMVLSLWTSAPGETFWKETDCRTAAERTERMMDCARRSLPSAPGWRWCGRRRRPGRHTLPGNGTPF